MKNTNLLKNKTTGGERKEYKKNNVWEVLCVQKCNELFMSGVEKLHVLKNNNKKKHCG